jgi:hypothetical protein
MRTLKVKAQSKGKVVDWYKFRKGVLRNRGTFSFLTTALTDVITDVIGLCRSEDPHSDIKVVIPNGFFSSAFDLSITAKDFKIVCGRRLTRGFFPLNPIAAEFAYNYDVILSIDTSLFNFEEKLVGFLKAKYKCDEFA